MEFDPLAKSDLPTFPHVEQYLGVWAIEPASFDALWQTARSLDLKNAIGTRSAQVAATSSKNGEVAVVEIRGAMTKYGSSLSGAGSTVNIRSAIRSAASDPSIGSIVLVIDSPGGTVAGTQELAADIRSAKQKKPVVAFVEDMAASAGYWVASQATAIYANTDSAFVGSVGTFVAMYDYSAAFAEAGIKPVVVKTGEYKAAGTPGTEINAKQIEMYQGLVNSIQKEFSSSVRKSRSLSDDQMSTVTTAELFTASRAQALGLIDGVKSYEQVLAEANKLAKQSAKGKAVSETTSTPSVTAAAIREACPGCTSEFVAKRLEIGASLDECRSAHMELLQVKNEQLTEQVKSLEEKLAKSEEAFENLKASKGKHAPVGSAPEEKKASSAVDDFKAAVDEKVKAGMARDKALKAVVKENPELHKAYLAAVN